MDNLIKLAKNTLISVLITAYKEKSHTIEKKSQMSQNELKIPIPVLNIYFFWGYFHFFVDLLSRPYFYDFE
jgi:hypothetical protein